MRWPGVVLWAALTLPAACSGALNAAASPGSAEDEDSASPQSDCAAAAVCQERCDAQDASACEWLGRMHETGEGVPQDYQHAASLYEHACNYGRADSCAHLAMMYDIGLAVNEDSAKAGLLYAKACEGGNRWACKRASQLAP